MSWINGPPPGVSRKAQRLWQEGRDESLPIKCPYCGAAWHEKYKKDCSDKCREQQMMIYEEVVLEKMRAEEKSKQATMAELLAQHAMGEENKAWTIQEARWWEEQREKAKEKAFWEKYPNPAPFVPRPLAETDKIRRYQPGGERALEKWLTPKPQKNIGHGPTEDYSDPPKLPEDGEFRDFRMNEDGTIDEVVQRRVKKNNNPCPSQQRMQAADFLDVVAGLSNVRGTPLRQMSFVKKEGKKPALSSASAPPPAAATLFSMATSSYGKTEDEMSALSSAFAPPPATFLLPGAVDGPSNATPAAAKQPSGKRKASSMDDEPRPSKVRKLILHVRAAPAVSASVVPDPSRAGPAVAGPSRAASNRLVPSANPVVPAPAVPAATNAEVDSEDEPGRIWCSCKDPTIEDNMIKCKKKGCKIKWFHWDCVRVRNERKREWYCEECSPGRKRAQREMEQGKDKWSGTKPPVAARRK